MKSNLQIENIKKDDFTHMKCFWRTNLHHRQLHMLCDGVYGESLVSRLSSLPREAPISLFAIFPFLQFYKADFVVYFYTNIN